MAKIVHFLRFYLTSRENYRIYIVYNIQLATEIRSTRCLLPEIVRNFTRKLAKSKAIFAIYEANSAKLDLLASQSSNSKHSRAQAISDWHQTAASFTQFAC